MVTEVFLQVVDETRRKCVLSIFSFSLVAVNLCVISEVVVSHVEFRYSLMKWAVVEDVENWPMY